MENDPYFVKEELDVEELFHDWTDEELEETGGLFHILGLRYTVPLLYSMYGSEYKRFNQLKSELDAPAKMITQRLKQLIEEGLVNRKVIKPNNNVQYSLTSAGRDLIIHVDMFVGWASAEWMDNGDGDRIRNKRDFMKDEDGNLVQKKRKSPNNK